VEVEDPYILNFKTIKKISSLVHSFRLYPKRDRNLNYPFHGGSETVFCFDADRILATVDSGSYPVYSQATYQFCLKGYEYNYLTLMPTTGDPARPNAWFFGRSLAASAGSNPAIGMDVCLF
jgi:hypothetical protein